MADDGGIGGIMWAGGTVMADGTPEGIRGASVIREAVGTYLLTLDRSMAETNGVFLFSLGDSGPIPITPRFIEHYHIDPTQIRVWTMSVGVVLFDHEWHFGFWRIGP